MKARNMARWVMGIGVLGASLAGATQARAAAETTEQDLGPTPGGEVLDVSLILKLKHADALESYVSLTQRPGQPYYHHFLTVPEFTAAFAPSIAEIASIQNGALGIRDSQPGQSIVFDDPEAGAVDVFDMPAGFVGRNVPDVSLNADPQTGYLVYWATAGGLLDGIGGTSVVSPQLNGMSALVSAAVGTRLGAWNPMLYRFKRAYRNASDPPLVDVTTGDNWFYEGAPGFEPAAGLGVLNLASFVAAVEREMPR